MKAPRILLCAFAVIAAFAAARAAEKWQPLWDGGTLDGWHVIGIKSAKLKDDPGLREGKLALQVHGGQDCEAWFKDIEIMAA